jgi:hypothetical protein
MLGRQFSKSSYKKKDKEKRLGEKRSFLKDADMLEECRFSEEDETLR